MNWRKKNNGGGEYNFLLKIFNVFRNFINYRDGKLNCYLKKKIHYILGGNIKLYLKKYIVFFKKNINFIYYDFII